MISSTGNEQIKQVAALCKKAKYRNEEQSFVVEGIRMFKELPADRVKKVYASSTFLEKEENRAFLTNYRVETVTDEVFMSMSDTRTPQGILAVARQYDYDLKDVMKSVTGEPVLLMVLETIQDPGNLGTILRAGEGAGVTGIIMNRETVDIYNPKVIRSTMGSVFRMPFVYTDDLSDTITSLKKSGIKIYAAHLDGRMNYDVPDYTKDCGFLVGNEAKGISGETAVLADTFIRIPMKGKVESLNAAVASSILMYEAARQRRLIKI